MRAQNKQSKQGQHQERLESWHLAGDTQFQAIIPSCFYLGYMLLLPISMTQPAKRCGDPIESGIVG